MSDSPISGTWGGSITGSFTIAAGTIDTVLYTGAVFGAGGGGVAILQGPGTLESSGNASVNQYSGASTQLELAEGLTWESAGTIVQNGGVQFGASAGDSATLVNEAGAIYDLNGGNAQVTTGGAGTYSFVNAGLLEMTSGGSDTLGVPLDNSGTVAATNGNFYLSGPVTNSGTLVADGGFLEVQGGTLGGTIEALSNNVALVGTYSVAAGTTDTVTFESAYLGWGGDGDAVFAGPGTLVSNGFVYVYQYNGAATQLQLTDGVTWDNAGFVQQEGGLAFGGSAIDTATIVNEAGATYLLNGGNAQITDVPGGTYDFVNDGLLEMNGGGNDSVAVPLDNSGTVVSTNGGLYLSGTVSNSGTLLADGGFLEVQGGTLGGTIEAISNNLGLVGTYAVAADTTDTVTFGSAYLGWGGDGAAVLAGPGTLASNGFVYINQYNYAATQLQLADGITWENAGTVRQYGGLMFGGSTTDSATIVNQADATYELWGGNAQVGDVAGGTYDFINDGLLEMVAGGSVTFQVPLNNSGTVLSTNGALYLSGPVANSGTLAADGGFIEVQGGTLGGTIEALADSIGLVGTYAVAADTADTVTFGNANLGWYSDGYAVFAGPGTLVSNGNVAVSQYNYSQVQLQLIDGITWDNAGTVNQYGGLIFGGSTIDTATIINQAGATYVLDGGNAQIGDTAGGTYSFVNAGTLEMVSGGGDTISVPLVNTGLVTSTNGQLVIAGGFTNSGTMLANGGQLYLEGGTLGGSIGVGPNGNSAYLTGTYAVAGGATDTVTLGGATFGDGGGAAIATFSGPGTIAVDGAATVNNYYYSNPELVLENGVTWDNFGAIYQIGGLQFGNAAGDSATLVNEAGATYSLSGGNADFELSGTAGTYSFVNDGLLQQINGGGDSIAVPLENTGVISSDNGEIYIDGPLTNSGTIQTAGGSVQINGGTLGGTLNAANGAIWLLGTYALAGDTTDTVTLGSATFGDGGGAAVAYLSGSGTLATDGSAIINNYYYANPELVLENGATWDNFGAISQYGGLQFGNAADDSATFVNETGATYTLVGGSAYFELGGSGGTYNFINNGLLQMVGGGSDHIAVPLDNTGLISSDNGEIYIDGALTNGGTIMTAGGSLQIDGGGSLGGTLDAANGAIWVTGTYTASYGVTDTASLTSVTFGNGGGGGIAYLSGPGTLATSGSATITNYYYSSPDLVLMGGITWDDSGSLSVNGGLQFGNQSGDSATLDMEAGSVLDLTNGSSALEAPDSGTYALIESGLLEMTGGGTDSIAVAVDETSTGTITAANGSLDFNDGASISGLVNGSAEVVFDGGNVTVTATGDITTNTVDIAAGDVYMQGGTINSANLTLSGGVDVIGYGAIGDPSVAASVDASGGLLTVTGPISGVGSFTIESGATLAFTGSDSLPVTFDGTDATLKLDSAASFSGTINNFAGGDTIDLAGITLSAVSYGGGQLIGTLAAGGTISLSAPAVDTGLQLELGTDAAGASTIYLQPSTATAVPDLLTTLGPNNSLVLPDTHVYVSSSADPILEIENAATAPADGLDVSVVQTTGSAYGTGQITSLAPGVIDNSSIDVGLNDGTAGLETGTVALAYATDGSVSGIAGSVGTGETFTEIDLSPYVNAYFTSNLANVGYLLNGSEYSPIIGNTTGNQGTGIPFQVASTPGNLWYGFNGASSVTIPVGIAGNTVYTLIDNVNGTSGADEYSITFTPASGSPITEQYVGGVNTKDYNDNPATDGTDTTPQAAYWFIDSSGSQWLQEAAWTLPAGFGTLASVTVTQENATDGALFAGLTVGTASSELGTQTINLSGNVYRLADPSISAPTNVYLHVGDGGGTYGEALTVANIDPADGYSEGLDAAAIDNQGTNDLSANGATGDLAAGSSDNSSITVEIPTGTAGTVNGTVDVALVSDGTGVDTLGLTALDGSNVWSAGNDFSIASNANGVWSYLENGSLLQNEASGSNYQQWSNGGSYPNFAGVTLNPTTTTQTYSGTVVVPPGYVNLDPEGNGNVAVAFTAPSAGVYTFYGSVVGTDINEHAHEVAMVVDGSIVGSGTISTYQQSIQIDQTETLAAGDTVDFISYSGPGGQPNNLGTGLSLTVTDGSGTAVPVSATVNNYATAALSFQQAPTANIVQNGGFEANYGAYPDDWTTDAGYNLAAGSFNQVIDSPSQAYSGNDFLQFGDLDSQGLAGISQTLTTVAGETYTVSFYVDYPPGAGGDSNALFHASVDGNTDLSLTGGASAPNGWTLESFNFVGTGSDTLAFAAQTNPSEWFLDDISVVADSSPVANGATVDLGTFAEGPGENSETLFIANTAQGPADWLTGSLSATGSAAITDIGLGSIGSVAAGTSLPVTIDLSTATAGVFSQTITLAADSTNPDGSTPLSGETITVTGTVLTTAALAQPVINEPSPIVLPDVHVASLVANDQTTLDIGNTGSAVLSAAVVSASGDAYGSGAITDLPINATDTIDIVAGLNNTQAGALSGSIDLSFTSGTNDVPLAPQSVALEGNAYRYAAPFVTGPTDVIVHVGDGVGDTDSAALVISNTAAADGFSENLDATALGVVGGNLTGASGTAAEIAAGASDTAAATFSFSTATAGIESGSVAVSEISDGSNIDTLGTTSLGTVDVPVGVTVNNYATAAIQQTSGPGDLVQSGSVYTLDLGAVAQGAGDVLSALDIANTATGPADWITGSLSGNGDPAFTAYNGSGVAALSATYFEVSTTGNGPDFGGAGTPNVAIGSTLGPDGLPVASSPAGVSDIDPATQEITWWDPSLNSGVVETGTGAISLPYGSNMYAPNSTGYNDGTYYETAILQGNFSLASAGSVTFQLGSDDDSFIYVDGTLIGSNPGVHGTETQDFTASNLAVGPHTVEVFYDDRGQSGANLFLSVLTPGVTITPANGSALGGFGTIAAGGSTPFAVEMSSANAGVFTETVTLAANGGNASGYSQALPGETLVVTGTVLPTSALASPVINTPTPIALPDAHVATIANDQTLLSISNTGSAVLSAVVSGTTGDGYGSGAIDQLAIGGTDGTDIAVGVNNTAAGAKSGSVSLSFTSGANLISDGSFENTSDFVSSGNDTELLGVGSTVMQGWTVVGSEPLSWIGPNNPFGLSAADGSYFLDLTGYSDAAPFSGVSQTIATTAGDQYQLTFELGSSYYWGLPDGITATAGGTSQTFTSTLSGSNNWQQEVMDFTATSATTTISLVGASGYAYIGLDDVTVTPEGTPAPVTLAPQAVAVTGNVYNYATASIAAPASIIVHVGDGTADTETEALTVVNTAPAGSYSEGLEVAALGSGGGEVSGAAGATGDIVAQGTDDTSLTVSISTATAANGGSVLVQETSDGTNVDSLGTTSLGTVDVPVYVTVDNYASAAMEQTGGNGSMTPNAVVSNTYTLDLGATEQYASPLTADLAAINAAAGPAADQLDGSYTISGDSEYSDSGFGNFSGVNYGNALGGNTVELNTGTIGVFTQQITLTPTGTNASGYSGTLAAETIDVVGTIVPVPPPPPPPLATAVAWGDVHLTTFDGLYYNFQAEGEFILAQSTVPGDTFAVQARMAPYGANSTVSVMTMIGADVGGEQVTFGLGRNDVVAINGVGQTFAGNGASISLAGGGSVTQLTATSYQLTWGTGEVMDVTDAGTYFNLNLTLSSADGPGSIQGLLGSDTGQANDFQLADGTVLAQPLSSSELYGAFANAWRVTSGPGGNSLMDYLTGQGTATFTDTNFPADGVNVDNLPAAILQQAELEVQQAGITDPNQQAAAVLDLLVTGNPNALLDDVTVNQNGETTTAAEITVPPPPVPALGVSAVATNVVETAGGTTDVTFNAYLTNASGTDTVIDWAVTSPNATYLTAASLGTNPTSGFVVIPAGQTTGQFTVTLPTGVLGTDPSANLQVSISSTNGDPVFGQTAQTEIDNYQPVAGNPAIPVLTLASGSGTFSGTGGNDTLNLGTLVAGEAPLQDRFQIANDALAPSDLLAGSITASGSNFTVYGASQLSPLAAGTSYQGLVTEANTSQTGAQSETIVLNPVDENITGYSSIQPSQTVTITDTVLPDAVGDLLTGGPIKLGTFYQGDLAQTALDIENVAGAGAAALDVTASSSGQATATGEISQLAPGSIDATTIQAGIDTSSPGVKTGYVTLDYASDAGSGNTAGAGSQLIEVIGTVYGPATAAVSAAPVYVHRGDDGGSVTVPITISNTGTNNGYTENLSAQVVNFGTYVTAASGSVTDLTPAHSDNTALTATLSDANYGSYAGEVAITLQSDGTGIDSNGTTSLGMAYVQAAVDVDQYAVAAMEELSGNGTMVPTGVSTSYSLDLGTVAQYATPLGANIGVLNDVLGQSDLLAGSFSHSGAPEFTNAGLGPFGPGTAVPGLAAQQVDSDPVVVLSSATVGVFTETLTFDPIGYNPSGYSGTLAPETVTITGTVVAAPRPTPAARVADGWGDVHLTTFDGLYYNFQAAGEFVLSESTIPGDTFAIQARMQPYNGSSSVSINTMIGAEVGSDKVTFGIDRTDTVWIDGQGVSLAGNPVVTLADGTLEQTSADTYRLVWNTGEELDVTDAGSYLNVTVSLPSSDAGNVQGLLGNDNGDPANDLTLPGGAPIASGGTISYAQLYGTYAASWEVTDSTSLMDYQTGQDAASFYNPNFPYNQILLGNLPPNAYQEALAAAEAAGITDPNLLQAAIVDYLFTGNPQALQASVNVQQQEGTSFTSGQTVSAAPPPVADVGVLANESTVVELAGTADAIGFTAYLTSPEATDTLIDYSVNGNAGPGFLNASDFPGDILPSGTVTIAAGQTTALFTVAIPAGVLGSEPDANLQVVIAPQNPAQSVFAPEAQTEILNTGPTPGNPATPLVELLSGDGLLTGSGTGYELNLGSVEQYADPLVAGYGVENDGIVPADLLSGSFEVSTSSQFLNSGLSPFAPIATGNADTAPEVELLTNQVGTFTEYVTLTPTDSNLTNYSSVMPLVTIEVVGTIVAPPPPPPPPEPKATAWGDVHLTTFDGVYYNFQAAGEYVLSRSTVAGDTFQVQARLAPYGTNSSVTVQTQVGAAIGSDDVVFALTGADYNASPLYLNGTAEALGIGQSLTLSDGSVTETSANTYRVNWDTGESMTVTLNGSYISDSIEVTAADAGNLQGLLGPDDGNPSTDLQLPDGQSIASGGTITSSTLYGVYASDWQVPSTANSLLYYTSGQSPSTFVIPGFPEDALTLSQLPANLVSAAEAIVEAEGITNPNLVDAAVIDLLVTGDPNSVYSSKNVQEQGVLLNSAAVSIPTPLPSVGILADSTTALEPATGTLAVDYTVYLTAAAAQTSTVDYSVIGSGPNALGTADIVGGTGSGVVQIAAGQTSAQIVIDVLANALGSLPDAELQVGVTATGGETLFGSSAETEIVNPTPTAGNPAEALIEQLAGDGHLTGGGTAYMLNLGTQVQNGPDLYANLGIENGATVPADDLSGQFTITTFENYLNTGFVPFSNVAPGAADTEPAIALGTGTIGVYTETVVLDPTDTNNSGYSAPMNDVTLTVTGTIVPMPLPPPPSKPTAIAWGDVHLTTFDGLYYNFQAVGEFTLARSTAAGDSFNVQIRTTQYNGSSVSVIDQVAAGIGGQAVTFGTSASQPATVLLDGGAANFVNGVLTLADGTVTEESPSSYVVNWNSGESMTVNVAGSYINTTLALAPQDENGNVEGLLGYDNGVNNDFAPIVSGTTITTNQLYYGSGNPGVADSLADYWRVPQADSLLYYANGTDTADYTNIGFPADALSLQDLPAALQQEGLQEAVQAGITDPQLQQAAALDFIVTGDPDIVTGGANVQQQGITTTDSEVTGAVLTPALGVSANSAAQVEGSGDLSVGFTVFLTEAEAQATTVDYTVSAPDGAYLGASAFGGTLPSGSVTIAAGQTSATFSVTVPAGVLGNLPSSDLQVVITPTGGEQVFAPTAQTTIVNNQVEPGTPSDPMFALLGGEGSLTEIGNNYTLALGQFTEGATVANLSLAVENAAAIGSNGLAGSLTATSIPGYTVYGTGPLPEIAAGASYQGLHVAVNTGVAGNYSETITFTPEDQNASGYSAALTPLTLTITDSVSGNYASASPVAPNPVDFTNVHQGSTPSVLLSVENSAPTSGGAEDLDGSIGSATGAATDNGGSFTGLQPGVTNSSSLAVGLNTATEGVVSGSAVVSLESDGTGIDGNGITPLPSQTIDVFGTVYAYAAPIVSPSTLDFGATRVGGTVAAQSLSIADGTAADPYQESLVYGLQNTPPAGFAAGSGDSGTIVSGGTALAGLILNTVTAGNFNTTDTLALTSTGLGTSGLGDTSLTGDPITLQGKVYAEAVAQIGSSLNFGVVHVGSSASALLNIGNTASGALTDVVVGSVGSITGSFSSTGSLGAGVAAGSSGSLDVMLNTATSGVVSGSATLDLASHDPDLADVALTVAPVALSGTVDNYATAAIAEISGSGTLTQTGTNYALNLGTLTASSSPVVVGLGISNVATGLADLLSGSLAIGNSSGVFINNGDSAFAGLAAGQSDIAPSVTLTAGTDGSFTETITLAATGSNSSGYSGTLAPEVVTITGVVAPVIMLTTHQDIVNGNNNVTIVAATNTLSSGDEIDGGSGTNTLELLGGGTFNLSLPAALTNIQDVTATEGLGSARPTITLRNGTDLTLTMASAATNPASAGVVIYGANNDDTINLGAGADTVTIGGAGETVVGGSGNELFYVNSADIGATIEAGSGTNTMDVTGGGTMTMGANITGIHSVYLENAGTSYDFTANATAGLVIHASADTDTIVAGSASQTVAGSSGNLLVQATAANAGLYVRSGSGSNELEITTGGTIALNSGDSNLTVLLDAASTLLLPTNATIAIDGSSGSDVFVVTSGVLRAGQRIDGGGGTNTLELLGGGSFNLAAPTTLNNIQDVTATEGQGSARPTITLRNGTDLTLTMASAATNPASAGVVIYGANNDDTINLGAGADTVTIGGAGETVVGGSGNELFYVNSTDIGATIEAGSGTNTIDVTGGGTMVMGANITGIHSVYLENAGTSYDFTANATAGLVIHASADTDTIVAGSASQTVAGSSGNLLVQATAANAGLYVRSGSGSNGLEITTGGTVALNSGDSNLTVLLDAASTVLLTSSATIAIDGSSGNDVFVATSETLRAGQQIDGGGGINTLELLGGGSFNLAAPTTLNNIQDVTATEGQGSARPTITLRNGTDLTLTMASAATNPASAGVVIYGANNDDTINLGAGADTVTIGGAGETVVGGSGNELFYVNSADIGATIEAGSGTNTMDVTGGGTMTMGANITGIHSVYLENAGTSYDFTANATAGLVIHASADTDTIVAGSASQTVAGSSGNLLVQATAANAGLYVRSGSGSNELEITTGGTIALNSGDSNLTVLLDAASTLLLTSSATIAIDGSSGNDVFVVTSGVLRAGQQIDGGGGTNTLELLGGGSFNLAAPTTLNNIQDVTATEGQGSARPTITLRNGTDLTLTMASAAINPASAGVVIYGANNDDTINLGAGVDTVTIGGAGETIVGGSGNELFYVNSADIGATIEAGSGTNTMDVTGGGTMVMGANITGIHAVYLENAGTSYDFTANATAGMVIHASSDTDTITVGSASQTVAGSSGDLFVEATAANAGVYVRSGTGSNELDVTTSGTVALNSGDNDLTVVLDATNTTLALNHMQFIYAEGSGGADTIIAGAAGQVLIGGGANDMLEDAGHYGVTFQDTTAGIQGDTLADLSKVDTLHITDLALGSITGTPVYTGGYGNSSSGTLAIPTGSGGVDIKLTGLASGGVFSAVADPNGGVDIKYS